MLSTLEEYVGTGMVRCMFVYVYVLCVLSCMCFYWLLYYPCNLYFCNKYVSRCGRESRYCCYSCSPAVRKKFCFRLWFGFGVQSQKLDRFPKDHSSSYHQTASVIITIKPLSPTLPKPPFTSNNQSNDGATFNLPSRSTTQI